jgi:predicted transcriptional regulator
MIPEIDSYNGIKDELKFFTTSGVRVKLLISLNRERMTMDQLKDEFGYRTSTILPVLAELKSNVWKAHLIQVDRFH